MFTFVHHVSAETTLNQMPMKTKHTKKILLIAALMQLLVCLPSCGNKKTDSDKRDGFEDGKYCAEVTYYYNRTQKTSKYTLAVEVAENELIAIYWPNGGWLDDSHFTPPDISDGDASLTSNQWVDYHVRIIGEEGDCTLDQNASTEEEILGLSEEGQSD